MGRLEGLHALVTGGGRGIGAATAAALTLAGARVTVLGRSPDSLRGRVEAGEAAAYVVADVADLRAVEEAVSAAVGRSGEVSILVNNAGAVATAPFLRSAPESFRAQLDLHLMGAVHMTSCVLPAMAARSFGRIVNIASIAGLKGIPYASAYVAAKHALIGLTRSLALEMAGSGVTVNAVCPGYTDTDLVADSVARIARKTGRAEAAVRAELVRNNPQGRLITPSEVADAVVFLAGPQASAVSGATLTVAGGEI